MEINNTAEFFDRRPCNIAHSPLPVGTDEYFEEVRTRKFLVEPHLFEFMEVGRWTGKRVLDVGCGIGITNYWFAIRNATVVGIDLSVESLKLAERQMDCLRPDVNAVFLKQDAENPTLLGLMAPFDLIFAWGSLHHTPSPERALRALREQVNTGATLKLMLYHRRSWKALGLWWKHGERWREFTEAQPGCPVAYTYTRAEARRLVEGDSWHVESMEVRHIFPWRVADYREYRYVKAFPWNVCPQWLFRWLERRIGWHMLLTAKAI